MCGGRPAAGRGDHFRELVFAPGQKIDRRGGRGGFECWVGVRASQARPACRAVRGDRMQSITLAEPGELDAKRLPSTSSTSREPVEGVFWKRVRHSLVRIRAPNGARPRWGVDGDETTHPRTERAGCRPS